MPFRSINFAIFLLCLAIAPANAQFVPAESATDGPLKTPKLKILKTIPSAPLDNSEEEDAGSSKTARVTSQSSAQSSAKSGRALDPEAWAAFGAFQRGQYLTAMELALPRAQNGDAAAQTLLGELFSEGFGVGRNMDDAIFWYEQGAQNGDPSALYKMALHLTDGKYVERDEAQAREYMRQSADLGNPKAQFNFAQILVAEKPGKVGLENALPYFEKAAERGIPDAQYAVSQIYINALDVTEAKRAKARQYLISAARAGYDTARLDLAIWLVDGVGGDRDYEAGFEWMKLAALKGNVIAQNRLAHLYIQAIGTRGNPIEAGKWYVLSRRAGLEDPNLEDFYQGLTAEEQKQALQAANELRF